MIDLIIFGTLLLLGYGVGSWVEKSHYRSIREREERLGDVLVIAAKMPTPDLLARDGWLVGGNVVISVDYFKRFVSGLRNLLGGRVVTYESLLDRARREAILRMKKEALDSGANMIFNVKLETASISQSANNALGSIEVYAYGTAVKTGTA